MNPANYQNMGMPQMGMQMGQPPMGISQTPMGQQNIGQPQLGHPMVQQQIGQSQMGQAPRSQPQIGHMSQPQMTNAMGQQQQVLVYLRAQQIPIGWQQTYRIELRLAIIFQIITQLNILRIDNPQLNPLNIAIEFERKQFEISPDQMTYEQKCREKLQQLTDARQNKQRGHQNQATQNSRLNMSHQQMQNNAVFVPQPSLQQSQNFPHMQQAMPNPNLVTQQQQAQQQAQMQMRNGMGGQPGFASGQSGMNPSQQAPQGSHFQFTQQDQQQIQQIAQNMVSNMTQQGKMHLDQAVMSLQPQLRQSLTEKGVDLHQYVVKQKATQSFLQQRTRMAAQTGNSGAFSGPNPQASAMQSQQALQFEQLGNIDQIRRAQQDALHHQQEGQVVVPATGPRPGNPSRAPSRVQKTPQQVPQAAFTGPRPMQAPNQTPQQQTPFTMQKATPNTQQTPQTKNFAQQPSQNPQQSSLQDHTGKLKNALRTSQQNHGLATLNQPLNQSQHIQSPNPVQQTPKSRQKPLQPPSNGQQGSMPNGQQRPGPTASMPQRPVLPPVMQQHLNSLKTDEEKKSFIIMMRQKQQLQRQQAAKNHLSQQPQGKGQIGSNSQIGTIQNTPITAGQSAPNTVIRPTQGPQQPESQAAFRQGPSALNELQEKQMDNLDYPENILNTNSILAQVPGHVKSWAQLKSWVANNANRLPPDSLQKLKQLQAKHFSMRFNEPKKAMITQRAVPQQPPGQGPAPAAPMFPNGNVQQSMPRAQAPGQTPYSQMQPPTLQEVQRFRASLPKADLMSDDQIRFTIMSQKRSDLMNHQNGQLNAVQNQQILQQRYAELMKAQQAEHSRIQGLQQISQSQPGQTAGQQQAPQRGIPQAKHIKQTQNDHTKPKAPQQGVKRNSSEDVVEVQDPKFTQQQLRQPSTSTAPQPSAVNGQTELSQQQLASLNRFTPEQITAMNPAQRAAFENQRLALIAQANPRKTHQQAAQSAHPHSQPSSGIDGESNVTRVRQLREEVMRSMPPRQPVSMSPTERGVIIQKLRESKSQFIRITQSLPLFLSLTHNEARVKDIIRTHTLLSAQVRDAEHNPVENFSITLDEFTRAFTILQQYMSDMSNILQQMQKSNQHQQAQQSIKTKTPHTQQLSAANLQEQQAELNRSRAANIEKLQSSNKPPAAPTTSHVPFPFGSQSPQGIPQIFPKKNELTQEKLQLPVPKKQKKYQASSTQGQARPAPVKVDSLETQRLPATPSIRCLEPDCKHPPFASKALLERHVKDVHDVKDEQITDPLEYVLGGLRVALNLNEQGQSKPTEAAAQQILASKVSTSSQDVNSVKQEASTKAISGLKPPQPKASTSRPAPAVDPWANANLSQQWFSEVFRDVTDPNRAINNDFLASWLDAQPAPELSSAADDSPQSIEKASSHKSDISTTDNIDITIVGEDGFLTENWFDIAVDMSALEMAGFTNMDWNADVEPGTLGSLGKKAEAETSDEWLKVYAPEKYNERATSEKKIAR